MLGDISYHKAALQSEGEHSIHYSLRPINQSQKKPKIPKDKQGGEPQWCHFDGPNYDKNKIRYFTRGFR